MGIFQGVTPLVEPLALDEAFLDVRGARALFGDAVAVARPLRDRVRAEAGLVLTVGVAGSKFLAKLASTRGKPDGLLVVPPDRALEFLHPLPVDALWGAGQATIDVLARYGLRTVGDVAATPATLERALGPAAGAQLHQLAWAEDREVVPFEAAKSIGAEETFAGSSPRPRAAGPRGPALLRAGRAAAAGGRPGRPHGHPQAALRRLPHHHPRPHPQPGHRHDSVLHQIAVCCWPGSSLGRAPIRLAGVTVSNLQRADAPVQLRLGPGAARLGGGGAGRRRGQGPFRRRRHRPGLPGSPGAGTVGSG